MQWSNQAQSALVNPIGPSDFADYLAIDYDATLDAELSTYILTACEMAISYTNHELLSRVNLLSIHTDDRVKLQVVNDYFVSNTIKLARYPVLSVDEVTINGDVTTEYTENLNMRPAFIKLTATGLIDTDYTVTYTAGYTTASDIPQTYIMAIKQLAAFLYDNRGDCTVSDAIKQSGAKLGLDLMRMQYGAVL